MLETLWNDYLYRPLFNVLIWLYNNWSAENLGWAVVWLTVGLRIVLLPLSIVTQRNAVRFDRLKAHMGGLNNIFKNDPVMLKQEIRTIMRRYRVSPWAKTAVLAVQGLVLVVLYQVFVAGINGFGINKLLYAWNDPPGTINTVFYGYDIAVRSVGWAAVAGIWVLLDIYITHRKSGDKATKGEAIFTIAFPTSVFLILWWLPMVKALFILTSMVFSATITLLRKVFIKNPEKKAKKAKDKEEGVIGRIENVYGEFFR